MKRSVLLAAALLALAAQSPSIDPSTLPLLNASSLTYAGAFRLPAGIFGTSTFAYGGTAMAYNPARKSLFIVGHDQHQQVAEVSIPALVNSSVVSALNEAAVLQPFADPLEGKRDQIAADWPSVKVGGLLVDGDQLYGTHYIYYDASGTQSLTHWKRSTTLSQASVQGPYALSTYGGGYTSGYLARIPQIWQALLGGPVLNGQCCIPIISRTSYGPGAFALDVTKIGQATMPAPSPLVFYPQAHPLSQWDATSTLFNGSTHMAGVVFPEGSSSVLWFGRQGMGEYCYGNGTTILPLPPPDPVTGVEWCYDPTGDSKGNHAYPYRYYVWAYKAADFAAVHAGTKQPWELRPYATWTLSFPITTWIEQLQGVAYDPASQRIYLSQQFGDDPRPVIHAFDLNLAGGTPPPPPPILQTSPDPTTIPPASQIVDASGTVWTIGSPNLILKDGQQWMEGFGSSLTWCGGVVRTFGTDGQWWAVTGSGWTPIGSVNPCAPSPPPPPPPPPADPCVADPFKPSVSKWPASQTRASSGTWNPNGKTVLSAEFAWNPLRFIATDWRWCSATVTK